ncbi:MAG: DUF3604 domain-containing protein [Chromatiaceae bacterium]|nr:DUF3604 domain-containing protein [Chromatiaceae bacterium]
MNTPRSVVFLYSSLACVCIAEVHEVHAAQAPVDPPFEITESVADRPRCDDYEANRQPLFGTTHLHTGLSFDASIRFVDYAAGNTPSRAYAFAKGEASMPLPSPSGFQDPLNPLRNPRIDRPLDWGAVTDHSEHFGEMGFCKDFLGQDIPERVSMECRMINGFFYHPGEAVNPFLGRTLASNAFTNLTITSDGAFSANTRLPVCEANPELCALAELGVWEEHQHAAEEAYDRSSECRFTSFVAYENTSTPLLNNWHRNVIFRNDRVVRRPVTAIDMAVRVNESPTTGGPDGVGVPVNTIGTAVPLDSPRTWPVPPGTLVDHPLPQPFWNKLEDDCTLAKNVTDGLASRCDFITIPHNTNLGGGVLIGDEENGITLFPPLFLDPYNTEDAKRHAKMEPLVEIYQDKGSSECRYDPRFGKGTDTIDELCAFEILDSTTLGGASGVGSGSTGIPEPDSFGPRAFVRNIWKDGVQYVQDDTFQGVNPFKMGVVAASDSHTGVMGWHPENADWPGHLGIDDAYPPARVTTIQNSTGGHSVVWAEENTRDSIFEALERKETYGTSGTRPIVRFFGGWGFADDSCHRDFVRRGYQQGVPMGGDLPTLPSDQAAPRFIVAAWRDDFIKTNLQQIQIIKGWAVEGGDPQEAVYTVAGAPGDPLNPIDRLDPATCKPYPKVGRRRLCAVWEDPDFDPKQNAFYYVRVLEEPVCRYSTLWCRERIGVDPLDPQQCAADLEALANGTVEEQLKAMQGAQCCLNDQATETEHYLQPVIQERAWTSPIWYTPPDA